MGFLSSLSPQNVLESLGFPNPGQDYIDAPINAANIAAQSQREGLGEIQRQFDITQQNYQPWLDAGGNALSSLVSAIPGRAGAVNIPSFNVQSPEMQGLYYTPTLRNNLQPGVLDQIYNTSPQLKQFDAPTYQNQGSFNFNASAPQYQGGDRFAFNQTAPQYQGGSRFSFNQQAPGYQSEGRFNLDMTGAPEYLSQGNFNFNLEADPGYKFAIDEAVKAATAQAAGTGYRLSGNLIADITDRATGIASQYANDAFGRQLAQSQENYGRGVTDYNLATDAFRDRLNREAAASDANYGRGVTDYGINRGAYDQNFNQALTLSDTNYGRGVTDYGINRGAYDQNFNQALTSSDTNYGRGVTDYGISNNALNELFNRSLTQSRENYDRGITDFNTAFSSGLTANQANNQTLQNQVTLDSALNALRNQNIQNQFGLDLSANQQTNQNILDQDRLNLARIAFNNQLAQDEYSRGIDTYNISRQQSQDVQNANNNYLNWLATVAGLGNSSLQGVSNLGAGASQNAANLLGAAGDAQAAGVVGSQQNVGNAASLLALLAMA